MANIIGNSKRNALSMAESNGQKQATASKLFEKRIWNRGSIMDLDHQTLLDEFDNYDCDEFLSDTNYNNSHFTNQDESEVI